MHPSEIDAALEEMVILVDTREQETPALQRRAMCFGKWERHKLEAGDYSAKLPLPGGAWYQIPVAVERKMDFDELAVCYCKQRPRFTREFERARAAGIKIYLLIEGGSWEDAYAGNYHSNMDAKAFVASLLAWLARYNSQIVFCKARTSGKLIRDILYRESKEALLRMMDDG